MFNLDQIARVATAMVGALVLSTLSIAAAIGPATASQAAAPAFAQVQTDVANG